MGGRKGNITRITTMVLGVGCQLRIFVKTGGRNGGCGGEGIALSHHKYFPIQL